MDSKVALLQDVATRLRINSIKATDASKSGHPTSCSSIAEVMAVLFLDEMKYFVHKPRNPSNDRFVLSKGHAAPILYAAWAEAGLLKESDLLNLRKIDSDLEGHPTPVINVLWYLIRPQNKIDTCFYCPFSALISSMLPPVLLAKD